MAGTSDDLVTFSSRIKRATRKRLKLIALERRQHLQDVAGSIIEAHFRDDSRSELAAMATHLQKVTKEQDRLSQDIREIGEMLSMFIENWFCLAPELPVLMNERRERLTAGKARASAFFNSLTDRLAEGQTLIDRLSQYRPDFRSSVIDFSEDGLTENSLD